MSSSLAINSYSNNQLQWLYQEFSGKISSPRTSKISSFGTSASFDGIIQNNLRKLLEKMFKELPNNFSDEFHIAYYYSTDFSRSRFKTSLTLITPENLTSKVQTIFFKKISMTTQDHAADSDVLQGSHNIIYFEIQNIEDIEILKKHLKMDSILIVSIPSVKLKDLGKQLNFSNDSLYDRINNHLKRIGLCIQEDNVFIEKEQCIIYIQNLDMGQTNSNKIKVTSDVLDDPAVIHTVSEKTTAPQLYEKLQALELFLNVILKNMDPKLESINISHQGLSELEYAHMMKVFQKNIERRRLEIEFDQTHSFSIYSKDYLFDIILSNNVNEINAIKNHLKTNGSFILITKSFEISEIDLEQLKSLKQNFEHKSISKSIPEESLDFFIKFLLFLYTHGLKAASYAICQEYVYIYRIVTIS